MTTAVPGATQAPDDHFFESLYAGGELLAAGRVEEARAHLEVAYSLQPQNEKAQNLLGLAYFKLGRFPEAAAVYEKLVNDNPVDATLRVNLGLVFLKTNELERAVREFETATDLQPEHKKAHNYLGLSLAQLGYYESARDHFRAAGSDAMAEKMQRAMDAAAPAPATVPIVGPAPSAPRPPMPDPHPTVRPVERVEAYTDIHVEDTGAPPPPSASVEAMPVVVAEVAVEVVPAAAADGGGESLPSVVVDASVASDAAYVDVDVTGTSEPAVAAAPAPTPAEFLSSNWGEQLPGQPAGGASAPVPAVEASSPEDEVQFTDDGATAAAEMQQAAWSRSEAAEPTDAQSATVDGAPAETYGAAYTESYAPAADGTVASAEAYAAAEGYGATNDGYAAEGAPADADAYAAADGSYAQPTEDAAMAAPMPVADAETDFGGVAESSQFAQPEQVMTEPLPMADALSATVAAVATQAVQAVVAQLQMSSSDPVSPAPAAVATEPDDDALSAAFAEGPGAVEEEAPAIAAAPVPTAPMEAAPPRAAVPPPSEPFIPEPRPSPQINIEVSMADDADDDEVPSERPTPPDAGMKRPGAVSSGASAPVVVPEPLHRVALDPGFMPMETARLHEAGPQLALTETDGDGPFHLGADGVALRVKGEMMARLSGLVAVVGEIDVKPEFRRSRGRATNVPFGEGPIQMQRISGQGVLYLEPGKGRFVALELSDEGAYFKEDHVWAFEETVSYENARLSGGASSFDVVHLAGTGCVLLKVDTTLKSMAIPGQKPIVVPLARLLGWHGRASPRLLAFGGQGAVELSGEGGALLMAPG